MHALEPAISNGTDVDSQACVHPDPQTQTPFYTADRDGFSLTILIGISICGPSCTLCHCVEAGTGAAESQITPRALVAVPVPQTLLCPHSCIGCALPTRRPTPHKPSLRSCSDLPPLQTRSDDPRLPGLADNMCKSRARIVGGGDTSFCVVVIRYSTSCIERGDIVALVGCGHLNTALVGIINAPVSV
ncbi:hypothetical protein PYCCODRAFT_555334 [Trametes coccinea BRFM310]|uniref:Uncharacterized protein n=1 Tax=Trametes coccinea (strain BRFM310) TaxID=1353009 RepID=A0A1Y2IKT2_TRAC3|nr:hypothetical protein PYCCODRAFT_555334 [Trametes coccinea BRFM310]